MNKDKRPKAEEKHIVEIDETEGFNLKIKTIPDEYCMRKFKEIFYALPKAEWIESQDLENLSEELYNSIFKQDEPIVPPTFTQIKTKLINTEKALRNLYKRLNELDCFTLQYIASKNAGVQLLPECKDIAEAHSHIYSLVSELNKQNIKASRGKKKDPLREMYLEVFVQIYQIITGKKITFTWDEYSNSYKGEFYDFVVNIFDVANIDYSENEFAKDAMSFIKEKP